MRFIKGWALAALVACTAPAFAAPQKMFAGANEGGFPYTLPNGEVVWLPGFVAVDPNGNTGGTIRSTSTPASGTITTANTFQSVLAPNTSRNGCLIQNTSAVTEYAFLGAPGSATTATSVQIPSGGSLSCNSPGLVITDQISLTAGTTGAAFVVVSQ